MPRIRTRPLTPTIGALVENVDLAVPLDEEQFADIQAALLKHQVIFFENQRLTPVQHRDFAARFGALHTHPLYPGVPEAPELFTRKRCLAPVLGVSLTFSGKPRA
jgi:taurine dioxygenase